MKFKVGQKFKLAPHPYILDSHWIGRTITLTKVSKKSIYYKITGSKETYDASIGTMETYLNDTNKNQNIETINKFLGIKGEKDGTKIKKSRKRRK